MTPSAPGWSTRPDRPCLTRCHAADAPRRARTGRRLAAVAAVAALIVAATVVVVQNAGDRTVDVNTSPGPTRLFPGLAPNSTVTLPPGPIGALAAAGGIWTGTELIVWGEPSAPDASPPPEGASFNPETGTWRIIAPAPISNGSLVRWTGREMIVWSGRDGVGAAYDPKSDSWRRLPEAPIGAGDATTAVWTGRELIVLNDPRNGLGDPLEVAAYDPATDEWRALPETNGDLTPFIGPAMQDHTSQVVWTGTTGLTILDVRAATDGSGRGLARYDLRTDTWHIDADAHYATLVGVPDRDGVTRTVLAMPVEPGQPLDLLDASGNAIGSLPAHPVDLGGSTTDATGLWLGKEAVFWIRGADQLLGTSEVWAVDPASGTWRPVPGEVASAVNPDEGVAVGDVLLSSDGTGGIAYRAPT